MTHDVRMTAVAIRDIERNAEWWAREHSREQAEIWFNAIHEQLQQLALFPEGHPLSSESGEFGIELRDRLVGLGARKTYPAVFTIKDSNVFVLRVRRTLEQRLHTLDLPEDWRGDGPSRS